MPHTQCWMVFGNHDSKCANSNSTLIRGNYLQFSYYLLEVPNFPTLRVTQRFFSSVCRATLCAFSYLTSKS